MQPISHLPVVVFLDELVVLLEPLELLLAELGLVVLPPPLHLLLSVILIVVLAGVVGGFPAAAAERFWLFLSSIKLYLV